MSKAGPERMATAQVRLSHAGRPSSAVKGCSDERCVLKDLQARFISILCRRLPLVVLLYRAVTEHTAPAMDLNTNSKFTTLNSAPAWSHHLPREAQLVAANRRLDEARSVKFDVPASTILRSSLTITITVIGVSLHDT